MTDQCKHCSLRGDLKTCKETECSHHENWYAIKQQELINKLEAKATESDAQIAKLQAELAEAKKDAERLNTLMAMSGEMYAESVKHQFVGRLQEFIDKHTQEIDEFLKVEK
jgi:predicted RNase H-like nuclease (RuvC/YqgF family)